MRLDLKQEVINKALDGTLKIKTDYLASPTGFPFKVANISGTMMSDVLIERTRTKICDECALREPYRINENNIGYRCASEPEEEYEKK